MIGLDLVVSARDLVGQNMDDMAKPKQFKIKEEMSVLRAALRKSTNEMTCKRIRALIVFKEYEDTGISKEAVAALIGIDQGSARKWRKAYIGGGLPALLAHRKKGNRPSANTAHQREALREKLHDPRNGLRGYTELVAWFNTTFGTAIPYKTLNQLANRNFGAMCKTARKSHVKKDPVAVQAFKKKASSSSARP